DSPAQDLHEVRKAAKRLRYLVECFGGTMDASRRTKYVKALKKLQDNLGEHQDAVAHGELLRGVAADVHAGMGADAMLACGRLVEAFHQRQVTARAEFVERFAAYDRARTRRALRRLLK